MQVFPCYHSRSSYIPHWQVICTFQHKYLCHHCRHILEWRLDNLDLAFDLWFYLLLQVYSIFKLFVGSFQTSYNWHYEQQKFSTFEWCPYRLRPTYEYCWHFHWAIHTSIFFLYSNNEPSVIPFFSMPPSDLSRSTQSRVQIGLRSHSSWLLHSK